MLMNHDGQSSSSVFKEKIVPGIRHLFLHNGWIKLTAVLISVILWAGLISQDETLTRDKTFNNVPVNISGTDSAKRNGYIVISDMDALLNEVSITAAVPQHQYEDADPSVYNLRLDLSKITGTGEQELKLQTSTSGVYGRVTSVNPATVNVEVEEYTARYRIPVSVSVDGQTPTGWYMSTPSVDLPLITVSGPKSIVNTITRGKVFLNPEDLEWTEGSSLISLPLQLFNRAGEVVESNLLEVTYDNVPVDTVIVEQMIMPTKTFDLSDMITTTGNPANGYEVRSIQISPETLTVAAHGEVLEQMTEPALMQRTINIRNLKETTTFQIKITKPSDEAVLSNDTVTVVVEIGPRGEEK